jgi:hypothetical protein
MIVNVPKAAAVSTASVALASVTVVAVITPLEIAVVAKTPALPVSANGDVVPAETAPSLSVRDTVEAVGATSVATTFNVSASAPSSAVADATEAITVFVVPTLAVAVEAATDGVEAKFAAAADAGTTDRTPAPKAATATSAMRLKVVFVDICFLSISRELRTIRVPALGKKCLLICQEREI